VRVWLSHHPSAVRRPDSALKHVFISTGSRTLVTDAAEGVAAVRELQEVALASLS
jgi:hypothetical protein